MKFFSTKKFLLISSAVFAFYVCASIYCVEAIEPGEEETEQTAKVSGAEEPTPPTGEQESEEETTGRETVATGEKPTEQSEAVPSLITLGQEPSGVEPRVLLQADQLRPAEIVLLSMDDIASLAKTIESGAVDEAHMQSIADQLIESSNFAVTNDNLPLINRLVYLLESFDKRKDTPDLTIVDPGQRQRVQEIINSYESKEDIKPAELPIWKRLIRAVAKVWLRTAGYDTSGLTTFSTQEIEQTYQNRLTRIDEQYDAQEQALDIRINKDEKFDNQQWWDAQEINRKKKVRLEAQAEQTYSFLLKYQSLFAD